MEYTQLGNTGLNVGVAGLGCGRFLSYQVEPYVEARKLRVVLQAFEPELHPVSVVYPQASFLPARVRVFVDWLQAELGSFDVAP